MFANMDLERDFILFASSLLGIDASTVSAETKCCDVLKWDSVMHLRLVMETEARYGISIPMEEVPNLNSFASFISQIKSGAI